MPFVAKVVSVAPIMVRRQRWDAPGKRWVDRENAESNFDLGAENLKGLSAATGQLVLCHEVDGRIVFQG